MNDRKDFAIYTKQDSKKESQYKLYLDLFEDNETLPKFLENIYQWVIFKKIIDQLLKIPLKINYFACIW